MENERIAELVELLNRANFAYEHENRPIMTDFEYDRLYDELLALEAKTGLVLETSPTTKVGHEVVSALSKMRHDSVLLSLDKTKEISRLEEFLSNAGDAGTGVLSWKLDGLSIVLKYSAGRLAQALTRGNGEIGEDVTHNARFFRNIPPQINFEGNLTVRGEAIISFSEFERINEELPEGEKYKNPRNLCSGTIRQLNTRIAASRKVEYYPFSLVDGPVFEKKSQGLQFLIEQGFEVAEHRLVNTNNVAQAVEHFKNAAAAQDFATDGLVLTYDGISFSRGLGATSKFPRDSLAFKWADELQTTRLLDIEWSTSRTGLINPIAIFSPVEIEGTTVERASLHNISILEGLMLGVGDEISVYKANTIIPQIAENFSKTGAAPPPAHCPVCNSQTLVKEENDTKTLHCSNPNCRARVVRTITHFASRNAMNIEGFSQKTVEKFIEQGFLSNFSDIYNLACYESKIKDMEGFGELSFTKLMAAIDRSKNANPANFVFGLGIDNVGLAGAKLLCKHFGNDFEKIRAATPEELTSIEGFGGVIANSLHSYFQNEENNRIVNQALNHIKFTAQPPTTAADSSSAIRDKTFVITGELAHYANRKALQEHIETLGGKVAGSVSKKTDYLINNDAGSASTKNKKARVLGVAVITEEEFAAMVSH